jgi:hypothetical protein
MRERAFRFSKSIVCEGAIHCCTRRRETALTSAPKSEPSLIEQAQARQRAYAAKRRAWAKAVGRPYAKIEDHRPPPGELDAGPDEG